MSRKQTIIIVLVTLAVAIIHTLIPQRFLALHIILRLLYFIPIILAALSGGRKGGLIVAGAISLVFLPHFFFHHASREFMLENAVAIVLFMLSGFFVGSFRESSEIELNKRLAEERMVVPVRASEQQRVLFYNDGSYLSLATAEWFIGKRYNLFKMSMVLLMVSTQDREEMLADTMAGSQNSVKEQPLELSALRIKNIFLEGGIEEKNLETVVLTVTEKIPVSDKIIEYLGEHEFDLLLLCKHNKKKSEEFLFGDTAIQVLRKTNIPLLIVKGTGKTIV
ncbi:MAG: UspA protein [uncultured bacterium]|nr:MAG: UspA protein [uncultured bacterium]